MLRLFDKAGDLGKKSYQVGEAIERLRKAAAMVKEVVGANHPEYASALDRFGKYDQMTLKNYREDDPQWQRVHTILTQALEIRSQTLGEIHPDYAESLEDLFAMAPNVDDPCGACRALAAPGPGGPPQGARHVASGLRPVSSQARLRARMETRRETPRRPPTCMLGRWRSMRSCSALVTCCAMATSRRWRGSLARGVNSNAPRVTCAAGSRLTGRLESGTMTGRIGLDQHPGRDARVR